VSCGLNCVSWVDLLEALNFGQGSRVDGVCSFHESSVDLAVAVGPNGVVFLSRIEVSDPVADGSGALENDVDRLVRWKVSNIALSICGLII
jgi:hypothetical protein